MIRVFKAQESNETLESSNGDCIIIPSKAIVHKYENSDYYLELEAPFEYSGYFEEGRIVVADLPDGSKEFFRMRNIIKTNGKCKCKCYHIFYDMQYAMDDFDVSPASTSATTFYDALVWLNNRLINTTSGLESDYKLFSILDYTVTGEADFAATTINFRAKTMYEYVQSLMKDYGGYLVRNKRSFGISRIRPTRDNGVTIQYGKNLKSITKEEDWSEVCTYLQAYTTAQWGQKEYFAGVDYGYKFNRIVRFDVRLPANVSNYDTAFRAKLDEMATAYLNEKKYPKIKYTVDAYLGELPSGTLEIQDIGDQVKVIDEQLGVDITAYVLGFDLDLLTGKYVKVEFGNYTTSMKGYNDRVKEQVTALEDNVTNISFPVGSIFQTTGSNPNALGIQGNWELVTSSGGVYVYRRVH